MPLPLRRRDFDCLVPVAQAAVLLFDEAAKAYPPTRLIAQLYGLTPAESRLAAALLSGRSLTEYGEQAKLSRNTLKTHLRSLFAKTDTARQSELVGKLGKLSVLLTRRDSDRP